MIIGLTGTMGAGKGTVAEYLIGKGFEYHSYSNILKEEAIKRGYPISRVGLQKMGNIIRTENKDAGYLSSKIIDKIKTDKVVVDGVRNPEEVLRLKKEKNFFLIGIDAPQMLRFQRLLDRKRQGDPTNIADFKELDDKENKGESYGQNIDKCLKLADHLIINDSSIDKLKEKIDRILIQLESK